MAKCIYCGQNAGLFRTKHKECEEKNREGKLILINEIKDAILHANDFEGLESSIRDKAQSHFVNPQEIQLLYIQGFDHAVTTILEDGIISVEEEAKIGVFQTKHPQLTSNQLDTNGSLQKVVKASVLRDIVAGVAPKERMQINGSLPFLFQKSEYLIWVFQHVDFYEQRTRTEYQGRSQGIGIRITRGVYYRVGAFKGHPVKIEEMKLISTGLVALTNKHIYYASAVKNFKVTYSKLVTIEPYEDGIGFQKDGVSSRPQILRGLDGWFTYNLISNLYEN